MRIIHLLWSFKTGGTESMLVDIANEQCKQNDVHIVIINNLYENKLVNALDKSIKFYQCGRKKGSYNPLFILKLNYYLIKHYPDILHIHVNRIYKYVLLNCKKVRTFHNTNKKGNEIPFFVQCFAISQAVADEWKDKGYNIPVVINGIKTQDINRTSKGIFMDQKKHFVQISRLNVKQKGQDILLKALARVKEHNDNFVMHLVGEGPDEKMLKRMVNMYELTDYVIFEGLKNRDWIYTNLCEFDLFIQPSRYEGFGLTVAEACAAKIPVLVSNNDGPMEIIDRGKLGMTFINEDDNDLACKIQSFLNEEYDLSLIEKAYENTIAKYDVSRTAKDYLLEYSKVIN